jgi:hypothetical protein
VTFQVIVPLPRELREGDVGQDVIMVQRALARAQIRKWGMWRKRWKPAMTKLVKRFQYQNGLPVDGVYGSRTHKKLARYFDAYGASVMVELAKAPVEVRQAMIGYNRRERIGYTQSSARMMIVREKIADLRRWFQGTSRTLWEDCSSFATGLYKIGGRPDPNGYRPGYPGYGYTGTLSVHGARVSRPDPGDLGFYGAYPYTHVVICVGFKNGRPLVVSLGSSPGPLLLDYAYRSDFSHWRRYVR